MKKPLKITLIVVLSLVVAAGATLTILYFARPKGQSRGEVVITPANNTYIADNTKNIGDCSPIESLFILAYNLKNLNSYQTTLSGKVNASLTNQTISGEKYKTGGSALYISRSESWVKSTANQFFIENGTIIVVNGDVGGNADKNKVEKYDYTAYIQQYGTDFRELSNYELNENTITDAELVSATDGKYTYRYEIDVNRGVSNYRVNMYKVGGLSELPTFGKSMLEVVMTEDFMPVSVKQVDEYTAYINLMSVSCKATLIETFEKINDDGIEIPEYGFYKAKLD
ncbi:MAG: hypothetical protein J6Y43_04140 [Clostridia bacterium]|nr:hypothetical protein [Clostridia bacterium]